MRWFASILALLFLPMTGLADGKVFAPMAIPTRVTIPDQRALICWSNGVERLVIETRFTGEGTNFAWVIPVPAQPVVESASSGLFTTLYYLFQPEVWHRVDRFYLFALVAVGLVSLFFTVKPGGRLTLGIVVGWLLVVVPCWFVSVLIGLFVTIMLTLGILAVLRNREQVIVLLFMVFLGFLIGGMMLPSLARRAAVASRTTEGVEVLDRRRVGVFDVEVIRSKQASALQQWLQSNGFGVSSNAGPVIADYVKDGWMFVTAKLQRDKPAITPTATHPLSFTFPAAQPVYPMRLTGMDNGPVTVDLFVFGPGLPKAPGFRVADCTQPTFPASGTAWRHRTAPRPMQIQYSPLREWTLGSTVAARLSGTLTPEAMTRDIVLDWLPFREKRGRVFSYTGAAHYAGNWAAAAGLVGLGFLGLFKTLRLSQSKRFRRRAAGILLLATLATGAAVYLSVPKVAVRLVPIRGAVTYARLTQLSWSLLDQEKGASIDTVRSALKALIEGNQQDVWDNDILGGQIREEDSPGNYILRETAEGIEFVGYDAAGMGHVLGILTRNSP